MLTHRLVRLNGGVQIARSVQRLQFLENASILGGLVLAAHALPSLAGS